MAKQSSRSLPFVLYIAVVMIPCSFVNGQKSTSDPYELLKDLASQSDLEKKFATSWETLELCKAFVDSRLDEDVYKHCGRLAPDDVGIGKEFRESKGIYRRVLEVHEKYELKRMEEEGVPLERNLVPLEGTDKEIFLEADREAREVERLFLASVAQREFPELGYSIWKRYSPGTVERHRLGIHQEFEDEISSYELFRLIQFSRHGEFRDNYSKLAINKFLFDKFGGAKTSSRAAEEIAFYVSSHLSALIYSEPSFDKIVAAEHLCAQLQDSLKKLLVVELSENKDLKEAVVGKISETQSGFKIDIEIPRKGIANTLSLTLENGNVGCENDWLLEDILKEKVDSINEGN